MDSRAFVELVRDVLRSMGQGLEAARPVPEGFVLETPDGYLYVFVSDPSRASLDSVRRWCDAADVPAERLVVLSIRSLPPYWGPEVVRRGGTVVAGDDFARLVDALGIETPLIPVDSARQRGTTSVLPSVQDLEASMRRGNTWYEAGVMTLAARFYLEAARLKPEYLPAWLGRARALSSLGDWPAAKEAWEHVIELSPGLVEGRVGLAGALGGLGEHERELEALHAVVRDHPEEMTARIGLMSALIEHGDWRGARFQLDRVLDRVPNDPRLRFLHGIVLEHVGLAEAGRDEEESARRLGLSETEADRLRSMTRPGRVSPTPADRKGL